MEGHLESKYYLNSHKDTPLPNDNIRQSRRDSTEKELSVLSSASESIAGQSPTPYPTLTDSQQIKLNNIDIPLEVARSDSKYYLNSHKDTPLPTLTDSQQKDFIPERERIKLNNILHTGKLTNCNISTFSDYEFADSSFVEDVLDDSPEITKCLNASEIEKGCCYLI